MGNICFKYKMPQVPDRNIHIFIYMEDGMVTRINFTDNILNNSDISIT
ncbi:MAG: hypothetical protein RIR01_1605 [Bacteroidota bacterium]|jgi:hypothetical protein